MRTPDEHLPTREAVIARKLELKDVALQLAREARVLPAQSPERTRNYREVQHCIDEQARLEAELQTGFVPQHSPSQLISPRAFFVSPLFRVCSKRIARARDTSIIMKGASGQTLFTYSGPELRQSDGLVFMTLLNLARDRRAGEAVSFDAEELCRAVFQRYDGPARASLRDHIKRLQRGVVEFDSVSVQLCLRFEFPSRGTWSVSLDSDIVQLFKQSVQVWLDAPRRHALPEGLATWLYSFVESQSRLIPMAVEALRDLCGSDAEVESFTRTLRLALKQLDAQGVVDSGWSIHKNQVRWRKPVDASLAA